MRLLLLNTCGADGSVAIADTELAKPLMVLTRMPGRAASEMLVAAVREAMAKVGWRIKDVSAIVVITGPGSFTGVRVGLSAAKGFAEATGAPLIAVSRLAMLAASAPLAGAARLGLGGGKVCALLDAGRDEFYCGVYEHGVQVSEALLSKADAVAEAQLADAVIVCEHAVEKAISEWVVPMMVPEPSAADALPFAKRRFEDGTFDDPVRVDANYLRRTDVEIFSSPPKRRAS